jgi:hypothetical protein
MPFIRIVRSTAIDRPRYEAVSKAIDLDHQHPLGLMMHAAGEVDGGWQIINLWESEEYADQFDRDTLMPMFKKLTGEGLSDRQITGYEVKHLITP